MKNLKLGIPTALYGAIMFFTALFDNYLIPILMAGYILLTEEELLLRRSAVKTVALLIVFALGSAAINLLPDFFSLINHFVSLFGGFFYVSVISELAGIANDALDILKTVLFVLLGVSALQQKKIAIPVIDKMLDKYIN